MILAPPFTLSHAEADELVATARKVLDLTYAELKQRDLLKAAPAAA